MKFWFRCVLSFSVIALLGPQLFGDSRISKQPCDRTFELAGGLTSELRRSEARHGLFSRQSQEIVGDRESFQLLLSELGDRRTSSRRHARTVISDLTHKHSGWSELLREDFNSLKHLGKITAIELFGDFFKAGHLSAEETQQSVDLLVNLLGDQSPQAHFALKEAALDSLLQLSEGDAEFVALALARDLQNTLIRGFSQKASNLRTVANLASSVLGVDVLVSMIYKPQRRRLIVAPAFPRPQPVALQLLKVLREYRHHDPGTLELLDLLSKHHPSIGVQLKARQIRDHSIAGSHRSESLQQAIERINGTVAEAERLAHEKRREERLRAQNSHSHFVLWH